MFVIDDRFGSSASPQGTRSISRLLPIAEVGEWPRREQAEDRGTV
jgi:hypothetical protein